MADDSVLGKLTGEDDDSVEWMVQAFLRLALICSFVTRLNEASKIKDGHVPEIGLAIEAGLNAGMGCLVVDEEAMLKALDEMEKSEDSAIKSAMNMLAVLARIGRDVAPMLVEVSKLASSGKKATRETVDAFFKDIDLHGEPSSESIQKVLWRMREWSVNTEETETKDD